MANEFIIVNNVKVPIDASLKEAFNIARTRLKKSGLYSHEIEFSVYRRSVDARNKQNICFVYSVAAKGEFPSIDDNRLLSFGMSRITDSSLVEPCEGSEKLNAPPLIVGAGPAGLFCALLLAERGYKPIIVERGGNIEKRLQSIRRLKEKRLLDPNCNVQFGLGGAGTFSDGKLVTRINDPLCSEVLNRFVEFGADPAIKYIAKPHIGTDKLSIIVKKMSERIEELGGKLLFNTKFIRPVISGRRVVSAVTDAGEIETGALILAIGHSARDTYQTLINNGYDIAPKNFSVGMRIEHRREDIDKALYGDFAGNPNLGAAEYNLSYDTKNRGVYTFCMCPGGIVVPAASEEGGIVVNGMSYSSRSETNSNSAVVCSVFKEDYGSDPSKAIAFQRNIERKAFAAAGNDYSAPIITVGDFLSGNLSKEPDEVLPTYMDGAVRLVRPEEYLPSILAEGIKNALTAFGRKIKGFDSPSAVLTGCETRTSSPVRIVRDDISRCATGYDNLYPIGEGAGYAGGITSASVDGIKTALAVISKYKSGK